MPEKHDVPESEKIELPPQDVQNKIFELFERADILRQESKFDESINVFQEIQTILAKYPWPGKQRQIQEEKEETLRRKQKQIAEIDNQKRRAQEALERKKEEERLISASQRVKQKEMSEAENRKKMIAEQKARERQISDNAYNLLGQGTDADNKRQYDAAIQKYEQAKQLFQEINWVSEVYRVTELLSDLTKKKQVAEQEEQARVASEREVLHLREAERAKEKATTTNLIEKEDQKRKQLEEAIKTKKNKQELSDFALALIDEGNRLKGKQRDYEGAVEKYQEARKIMKQIGWEDQANKLLSEIATLKEEGNKYKKQQALEEERRTKGEQQKIQEQREEETRRQQMLRERDQELTKKQDAARLKKNQQEKSEKAFNLMDQGAKRKNQNKDYAFAIANYEEAGKLFAEIGWQGEAQKVITETNRLREEWQRYQEQLARVEEKRRQETSAQERERQEENARRQQLLKAQEEELAKKEGAARVKKIQQEKSDLAFQLIDQSNRLKNEKKDYATAIAKYEEAGKLFAEIGWQGEAQKVLNETNRLREEWQRYQGQIARDEEKHRQETSAQEREQQEEAARRQHLLKMQEEGLVKKEEVARLKKLQQEQSELAFNLIDQGNRSKNENKDFDAAIRKYEEAVKIFSQIGWAGEAQNLQTEITRTKEESAQYQKSQALEEEKRRRESQERLRIREEEEVRRQHLLKEKELESAKLEETTRIKRTQEKLSNMAFSLIDTANRVKFEEKDYATAIAKYEEAGKLLTEIKWDGEAKKVLQEINRLKEEWQRYQKQQALEEEKRKKEVEEREHLNQAEETRREQLLQEREKELVKKEDAARLKKMAQEKSDEAFALIDIANRMKDENKNYASAIEKYQTAQKIFTEIGWEGEAQKILAEIGRIKEEAAKYEKVKLLEEQKRQKEAEAIKRSQQEEEVRRQQLLQERERERTKLEEATRLKKMHQELSETAFKVIDEANQMIEAKRDYATAISRYQEAQKIFNNIGWQEESVKILTEIARLKEDWQKFNKLNALEEEKKARDLQEREQARQDEENRRLMLLREQERRNLDEMKKKEEAQYKQEASNLALKLIEDAENLAKQYTAMKAKGTYNPYPFDGIMEKYQEAKKIFTDIGWQNEIEKLLVSIQHHRTVKEQEDLFWRTSQQKHAKAEAEQREFDALIKLKEREEQQKREEGERKQQEERARKQLTDKSLAESEKLAEKALNALNNHHYEDSIEYYRQILAIYENIRWQEGIEKIQEAIFNARSKEKEYQADQARLRLLKTQKHREQEELEEQIRLTEKEQRVQEQKDRLSREARLNKQKRQEIAQSRIYELLEITNKLVREENFDDAIVKVQDALALFSEVDDPTQETQLRDFISDIKKKKVDYLRTQEQQKRIQQERITQEKAQQELIQKAEEERRKREEEENLRVSTKMIAQKRETELSSKAYGLLDNADLLITRGKTEQGLEKLVEARRYFQELGWDKELNGLDARIEIEKNKIKQEQERKEMLNKSKQLKEQSDKVYQILDNADALFRRGKSQLGLEKLDEALLIFKQLGWEKETDALEKRIDFEKQKNTQDQEKAKGLEKSQQDKELSDKAYGALDNADALFKRNKYQLGMDKLEEGQKIFKQLGWEKEVATLEQRMNIERQNLAKDHEKAKIAEKSLREKELADKGYEAIDKADAFFKRNKTILGLQQLDVALECFTSLGWEKEIQAVKKQAEEEQAKVQVAIEKRKSEAKSAQEKEQADKAYLLLDEAENHLRNRRLGTALQKYEDAAHIFKQLGWERESKQLEEPILKMQTEIKDEELARESKKKKKEDFTTSPEFAFQLLDESERLFRKHNIDDAIKKALEVKQIFTSQGWEKETKQVEMFIGTLADEKRKQQEKVDEAEKIREEKLKKESEEEAEKQRLIDERRRKRMAERTKRGE